MKTEEIISIEEYKEIQTYDLKVSPNNNFFLANGILSHNSGKSVFANVLANELNDVADYTVIYITEKDSDELANAFHVFKPTQEYHLMALNRYNVQPKVKPIKIYHPFSFNIPYKKKMPPIEFFTYDISKLSRFSINALIPSESDLTSDVAINVLERLPDNANLYDFLWELYRKITESGVNLKYDYDDMFIPVELAGDVRTVKNIKTGLSPLRTHYAIQPSGFKYNLDFVELCNDSLHFHHLTTKFISDKKIKIFSIMEFLNGIDLAIKTGKVKKQVCLVFEEMKILIPQTALLGFQQQLLNYLSDIFSRIRTKGYVIATAQNLFDINDDFRGLFSEIFLGKININDSKKIIKELQTTRIDQDKLRSLDTGHFVWKKTMNYSDEQFTDRNRIFLPSFANAEQGEDFFVKYSEEYPESLRVYEDLYKEFYVLRQEAENKRRTELKEWSQAKKEQKEVKELKKEGKFDEAKDKIKLILSEKKLNLMKQVYDLKIENPKLSWREIARKLNMKSHPTVKSYFLEYEKNINNNLKDNNSNQNMDKTI